MRTRNSASGHRSSSSILDNINVGAPPSDSPEEPPRKKLKLKGLNFSSGKSSPQEKPSVLPVTRPKRKSAGRARYADHVAEAEPESNPKPAKSSSRLAMSSDLPSSSRLKSSEPTEEMEEDNAPGYSANFLANFIEEEPFPPSTHESEATPKAVARVKAKRGKALEIPNSTDSPTVMATPIKPSFSKMMTSFPSSSDVEIVEAKSVAMVPEDIDSPETIIKKLQVACHALEVLDYSAGAVPDTLPPLPPNQGKWWPACLYKVWLANSVAEPDVDALLFAVAGSSPSAEKDVSPIFIGAMDNDMLSMIRIATGIFRSQTVTKNNAALRTHSPKKPQRGNGGRGDKGRLNIDKERFAMTALQALTKGGAMNVNCIVSRERLHLTWRLYAQLRMLVFPPASYHQGNPFLINGMPHGVIPIQMVAAPPNPGIMAAQPLSPHQFMHHPDIAAQYQQPMQPLQPGAPQDFPAPPHQFIFQQEMLGHQPTPKQRNGTHMAVSEQMNGEIPLQRSGLKLKLSRNHSGTSQSMGPPFQTHPHPVMMPHPDMSVPTVPSHGPSPSSHTPTPGTNMPPGDPAYRPQRGRFRINPPAAHQAGAIVGGD